VGPEIRRLRSGPCGPAPRPLPAAAVDAESHSRYGYHHAPCLSPLSCVLYFFIYLFTTISTVDGFGLSKRPCKNSEPCFYPTLVAYSVPVILSRAQSQREWQHAPGCKKRARGLCGAHVSGKVGAFWGELLLHVFFLAMVSPVDPGTSSVPKC
jgi:hypothetical protein